MSENEWPWNIPTAEFHPLGDEKFYWLCRYIRSRSDWINNGEDISAEGLIKILDKNRSHASQAYIAWRPRIESTMRYYAYETKHLKSYIPVTHASYSPSRKKEARPNYEIIKSAYQAAMENEKIANISKMLKLKVGYIQLIGMLILKGNKKGQLTITQHAFAKLLFTETTTVAYALRELERLGMIKRTKKSGQPTLIELIPLSEDYQYNAPCVKLERFKPKKKDKDRPIPTRPAKVLTFKQKV